MPRILILSDLHLECAPNWRFPEHLANFDIAVFAGDIAGSPAAALRYLERLEPLRDKATIYLPGNHEFYGSSIEARMLEAARAELPPNIVMLAPGVAQFCGVRIIGATLWTDYQLYGTQAHSMRQARFGLSDHFAIEADDRHGAFMPVDALARHQSDLGFIEAELAKPFEGPTVVVSHHAPARGSIHRRWVGDSLTPAFVSDLEPLIHRYQPELWVHGHVHDSFDYLIGDTRVICNPRGYGGENPFFVPGLIIDV